MFCRGRVRLLLPGQALVPDRMMAPDIVKGQSAVPEHGMQGLAVHGDQGQIKMNNEKHADDHETCRVHKPAELLDPLWKMPSEHKDQSADRYGRNRHDHGPGKKLLADVELTDPNVPEGDIVDPQAFDAFKEGGQAPPVLRPDRPVPDLRELHRYKRDGHNDKEQCGETMDARVPPADPRLAARCR